MVRLQEFIFVTTSYHHDDDSCTMTSVQASCLKYSKFGNPLEVLEIHQEEICEVKEDEVLVKILAASINHDDIREIQGKCQDKPTLPKIGGYEWVGDVIEVGDKIKNLRSDDRVVSLTSGLGAWRSHVKFQEEDLLKISSNMSISQSLTLTYACVAYRMLKDFVSLRPGDVVIQNGANSDVGQAVHQLCKIWNIKSVGIVKYRPDIEDLRKYLKDLGATAVLTEEELKTTNIFALAKPKLGINIFGGKSAEEITRHLENKGVSVIFGPKNEPFKISASELVDRHLKFVEFSWIQWLEYNFNSPEKIAMFNELCELTESRQFKDPVYKMVPLEQYKKAMQAVIGFKGFNNKTFILDFTG